MPKPKGPETVSRLALDPCVRALIDQIQEKTAAPSPSAAIALLVTRYAPHLISTWDIPYSTVPMPRPYTLS